MTILFPPVINSKYIFVFKCLLSFTTLTRIIELKTKTKLEFDGNIFTLGNDYTCHYLILQSFNFLVRLNGIKPV